MGYLDYTGLRYFLTRLNSRLSGKLDRVQSTAQAGRVLKINTTGNIVAGPAIWTGTQAQYDAASKTSDTLYHIVDSSGTVIKTIYNA